VAQFRLVSHADDDLALPAGGQNEGEALRVWLSDQQWMSILERIERQAQCDGQWVNVDEGGDRRDPQDPRQPISARCIIRVGAHGEEAGTYIVRTRNISAGGLGFVHYHSLRTGTRCTIALQTDAGQGMIVAGRIAWCREVMQLEVEDATYEIGVQFDRPIGLGAFSDEVA
jgi:hypothetical protein